MKSIECHLNMVPTQTEQGETGHWGTGSYGIGESVKGAHGNCKGHFSKYFHILANNVYSFARSLWFHLWVSNNKSNKTDFTQNLQKRESGD